MNPFLITGYISPEYFCDRREETERLTISLLNNRNVTLFSRRRIGKTALSVLLDKGIVYYSDKTYKIDDIFFKTWLQRN